MTMKLPPVTLVPGPLKCGVFVKLKPSTRNPALHLSVIRKSRIIETLRLTKPGRRRMLRPARPTPAPLLLVIAAAKADGSYTNCPGPVPPILRIGPTMSATWLLSGACKDAVEDPTVNVRPETALKIGLIDQPPI